VAYALIRGRAAPTVHCSLAGSVLICLVLLTNVLILFHPLLKLFPQAIDTRARSISSNIVIQGAAGSRLALYMPDIHVGVASLSVGPMNCVSETIPVGSLRFHDDVGCSASEVVGNLWRDLWYHKLIIDRATCRFARITNAISLYPMFHWPQSSAVRWPVFNRNSQICVEVLRLDFPAISRRKVDGFGQYIRANGEIHECRLCAPKQAAVIVGQLLSPIGLMAHLLREPLSPSGLISGSNGKIVGIGSPVVHLLQLTSHDIPLKNADYNYPESQKHDASSKPNHPFLGSANSILKAMYLACHALLGYGLCVLGVWGIWKRWRLDRLTFHTLLRGILVFVFAGIIVWHGFIVAQKLLTN
jgi:hypothetical protein